MKTAFLKGGAIIVSFVLISFTVSAQDFWKHLLTESSLGNVAMIMVGKTGKTNQATAPSSYTSLSENETFAYTIGSESDKPLNLESWMTKTVYIAKPASLVNQETDENLELEEWMTNSKYFRTKLQIVAEKDRELKLEDWMIKGNFNRM